MPAPPWLSDVAGKLTVRAVELVFVGLLVFGFLTWERHRQDAADAEKRAAVAQAVAEAATKAGATPVQTVSPKEVAAQVKSDLLPFFTAMIAAGARPQLSGTGTSTFKDTSKAAETVVAGSPCPSHVYDVPARRFDFDLTTAPPTLTRFQSFRAQIGLAETPDGKQRFSKFALTELDPRTGQVLDSTGVTSDFKVEVTPDPTPIDPWHLRLAALGGTMGVGGGVQVNPWSGLLLTAGGAYKHADPRGLVGLGWRLRFPWFDSTLGINFFATVGKGGVRADAGGSAEITR